MNHNQPTPVIANRYRVEGRIGHGGMGDVFKGVDTRTDQTVAIKRLKSDIVEYEPSLIERFTREGEALRRLNHPNIVKMLATVEEDGQHYLIMQYVPGGSLRDILDETPRLPVDRVLAIGIELADALTRAHHLKIIHRDLKPANVLLDEDGTPLLTDFGVARLGTRTRVTESGAVIGTYAYLSPEACMGESLDGRADIWSFGVMLYEMLTGTRPFKSDQPTAILLAIINNPVPDLTALRPDIPPALVELIGGMLAKQREDRLSSVRLVGAALEAIREGAETSLPSSLPLSGQPGDTGSRFASPTPLGEEPPLVVMGPPTGEQTVSLPATGPYPPPPTPTGPYPTGYTMTPYPAQPTNPIKWLAAIFGIVAVTVVIVLGILFASGVLGTDSGDNGSGAQGFIPPPTPPPSQPPPAQTSPRQPPPTMVAQGGPPVAGPGPGNFALPPDATLNREDVLMVEPVAADEYMVLVAGLEPVGEVTERDVARVIVNDLAQRLEREMPGSPLRIRQYPDVITTNGDAQLIAIVNDATVVIWGTYTADVVELHVEMGVTARFPDLEQAIFSGELQRRSLANTVAVTVQLDDELVQSAARPVLAVVTLLQTLDGSATETARLLAIMAELDGDDGEIVSGGVSGRLHQGLALALDDPRGAIDAFDRAIELDDANALAYILRASTYLRLGEVDQALRDVETAERLGPDGWLLPRYLRGVHTTAPEHLDEMIAIFDQIVAARPADWFPLTYRGTLHFMQGDYQAARQDLEEAIKLGPEANFPYLGLVSIAVREGDLVEAQQYLQTSMAEFPDPSLSGRISQAIFGEDASLFGALYASLGHLTLGQYEQALVHAEQALSFEPKLADLYLAQGVAHCALGEYEQAEAAYTRGLEHDPDFVILHALRAEVGRQLGKSAQVAEDANAVLASDLGAALGPVLQAGLAGEWDCADFFDFDYEALSSAAPGDIEPVVMVKPVEAGQVMVLVAPPEPLDGVAERDVARFVVDDLTRRLVEEIPYSFIQVRAYPDVITSSERAQQVARLNGAAVILWGHYTSDAIEYTLALGSTQVYPHIDFSRDTLEQTANVRVRLTSEHDQSLAMHVMNAVSVLAIADGSEYLFGLTMAMTDELLDVPHAEVLGSSYASQLLWSGLLYHDETEQALTYANQAIELNRGNPLGYVYRAIIYLKLGDEARYQADMETARRLGSDEWATMIASYVMALDYTALPVEAYDDMIAYRPDDWYLYSARGFLGMTSNPAQARTDLEHSMGLDPHNSSPYLVATMLALREGRIADAQDYMATVLAEYPNPHEIQVVMNVLMAQVDENQDDIVGRVFSAMTLVILGQYADAADRLAAPELTMMLKLSDEMRASLLETTSDYDRMFVADVLLWMGLAHCNLADYAAAEQAYSVGLDLNPALGVLHVLRAQSRLELGDVAGAKADWNAAYAQGAPADDFDAWVSLAEQGIWNCVTFFEAELPAALTDEESS